MNYAIALPNITRYIINRDPGIHAKIAKMFLFIDVTAYFT